MRNPLAYGENRESLMAGERRESDICRERERRRRRRGGKRQCFS
jgi:hypothetical protein